jgi:hypothetical protein
LFIGSRKPCAVIAGPLLDDLKFKIKCRHPSNGGSSESKSVWILLVRQTISGMVEMVSNEVTNVACIRKDPFSGLLIIKIRRDHTYSLNSH